MVIKETHEMGPDALDCLKRAVIKELRKKTRLGYDAIICQDGKPPRISAVEALKIAEKK